MAKTSTVDILPELEEDFYRDLQSSDRFVFSRIIKKSSFLSVRRKRGVTQRSLLPQVSAIWATLSSGEKEAWANAAAESNLNGWRLFVQDQCLRIKNEIAGVATPSLLHQSYVGDLRIEAPATEAKIIQIHPHFYYVSRKVYGKKGMYVPVKVTEDLALPVTISLNYSANLVSQGAGSFAKLYARFWHSYQGVDRYTDLEISLDYVCGWQNAETEITTLLGYPIRYDLYIHLYNLRGDLYFDNIEVEHSGQNWARDPFCKDVNQGFTRAFYQIPKHWSGVILPDGAIFESVYQDF